MFIIFIQSFWFVLAELEFFFHNRLLSHWNLQE
jgi:hypothetical protein